LIRSEKEILMGTQHLRETLKEIVRGEYAQAALQAGSGRSSCCGPVACAAQVEGKFLSAFVRARKPTAAKVLLSE
jgi:hypothetical protein